MESLIGYKATMLIGLFMCIIGVIIPVVFAVFAPVGRAHIQKTKNTYLILCAVGLIVVMLGLSLMLSTLTAPPPL